MSINIVVLAGKLAFEPEVKALESGLMVANLTIDVENKVKDSNGTIRYESCPIRCECFGDLADIARMMYKGQMVIAEGRLKYREYTNKQGKVVSINSVGLTKLSIGQTDLLQIQQFDHDRIVNFLAPQYKNSNYSIHPLVMFVLSD